MDYFLFIWSVASFIEKRIKEKIDYAQLEKATGFSYRHIRETFKHCTRVSLHRYIISRKLANAAFEIIHSNRNLTDIASEYSFDSYDTFTRAFKRETGLTPNEFRKGDFLVGRKKLAAGVYAPEILRENNQLLQSEIKEENKTMKDSVKTNESCILFGVPKVEYTFEECTPFICCLKACLNYMGQNIDYTYLMAASGAAFRLRWNTEFGDGSNIDIQNIYENPLESFERSFNAAGRNYRILERLNSSKQEFISFIKSEIDEGRPVIALGIIGPPEACIITGYKDNGDTLLGWNFFQNNPEFSKDTDIYENGYFACNSWWENKNTVKVMSIGEELKPLVKQKDILLNAIDLLSKERILIKYSHINEIQKFAGGQAAYDAWAKAISDDKEFGKNSVLPILFERMMCQNDAQAMVGEGRSYAACFIAWVGKTNENVTSNCNEAAKYFRLAAQCTFKMNEVKGSFEQNEATTRKFAEPAVRKQIVSLILEAKKYEMEALNILKDIVACL